MATLTHQLTNFTHSHWTAPSLASLIYFLIAAYLYRSFVRLGYYLYRWHFVMIPDLDGPPILSYVSGNLKQMYLEECNSLWGKWEERYGHVYRIRGGFTEPILIMTDPKGISYVMNNGEMFPRSETTKQVLTSAFGGGIFTAEGGDHKRQRKLLSPAFTATAVQQLSDILYDLASELKEAWIEELSGTEGNEATLDVANRIQAFATDAISRTAFAYNISHSTGPIPSLLERLGRLDETPLTVHAQILLDRFPFLLYLPNPVTSKWKHLRRELRKIANDVWDQGVREKGLESKVLDLMGKGSREGSVEREEAVAAIVGILFAGGEATSNTVSETLQKLALHPHTQIRLRDELTTFVRTHGRPIGEKDIAGLPYLDAVVKESFRMLANIPQLSRKARYHADIPLLNPIRTRTGKLVTSIPVKAGQTIHMPVRDGINTSPAFWGPDAKEWNPDRWIDLAGEKGEREELKAIGAPNRILTFGEGSKLCLGRFFAAFEIKILLVVLIQSFSFSLPPSAEDRDIVFHLVGPAVKAKLRGREVERSRLPLLVKLFDSEGGK